jgi:hypothetical protein
MTIEERVRELHGRAVRELIEAHRAIEDTPLVLAVRYGAGDAQDIHLLEALRGFPGGDDDEILVTEFEPSPGLRILGKLSLALGSPAQILAAAKRDDAVIVQAKGGEALFDDGSSEAAELRGVLGL